MRKILTLLLINFLCLNPAHSAFAHAAPPSVILENAKSYRASLITPLPSQLCLYSDPGEGYVNTVFGESAISQRNLGVPGEHCLIRKLGDFFDYKTSGSAWFGRDLNFCQEGTYRLHFNFSSALKRSVKIPPLPLDYTLTHGVSLAYKSPDGCDHLIAFDQNYDVLDLRLGPKSSLFFRVGEGNLCDVVEVLLYRNTLADMGERIRRMEEIVSRLRRRPAGAPPSTAASDVES
jgi:hypothetical protein